MKESKGERACREYFQKKYHAEFIRCRPKWLKGLELDGFNEELGVAFEYNGGQHYKYVPHYHKGDCAKFHDQVKRDVDKRKECSKRGIKLVIVPDIPVQDIPGFLEIELATVKPKKIKGCCTII